MKTNKDSYLQSLPIVAKVDKDSPVPYGTEILTFPVSGGTVQIDRSFLAGKSTLRLRNIKQCLAIAGRDNKKPEDRKWFNKSVRDVWHKVLRHANKEAISNLTPVSMGFSLRDSATKTAPDRKVFTSRFAYERVIGENTSKSTKAIAAAQARDKSKGKPAKGLANIGAVAKVTQTLTPKPEVETAKRETVTPAVETVA